MALIVCPGCRRHIRSQEPDCPFCGARRPAVPGALVAGAWLAVGLGLATLLCACYGPPPRALEPVQSPQDLLGPVAPQP